MTFDVVVIGGGMAGAAAALAAAERGARVGLIRAAPGVTALTTGAWQGVLPEGVERALAAAGLALQPCAHRLPHPNGELRACDHAGATHSNARIDERTLICGVAGLAAFHAPALARLWTNTDAPASSVVLRIDGTPAGGWSSIALAAAVERAPTILGRPLADAVRAARAHRAILPAVLGLESTERVVPALREAAGIEVCEALGSAPSVPGWRVARVIERCLRSAGVEVIAGRAHARPSGRRVGRVQVATATSAGAIDVAARVFILATGKFAGGGIAGDGRLRETTLACPVWIDHLGQRFDQPHALELTALERAAQQPLLNAGVRANGEGHPVGPSGDVVYEDVVVAGSVRSGVSTADLGLGGAAEDGCRAGAYAAACAR